MGHAPASRIALDPVRLWASLTAVVSAVRRWTGARTGGPAAPLVLAAVLTFSGSVLSRPALAGLPGYFEWVLWEETESVRAGESPEEHPPTFRWLLGPYAQRPECEADRDRLVAATIRRNPDSGVARQVGAGRVMISRPADTALIHFLCVPDTVNPRQDRRWQ